MGAGRAPGVFVGEVFVMMRHALFVGAVAAAAFGQVQVFDCTVNQAASGVNARITANATLPGTLIGNYDAATNATGTHTKPGLFGTFGTTENVAVTISVAAGISNQSVSEHPRGVFQLTVDPEALVARISGYAIDYLGGTTLSIPVNGQFTTEAFRTRTPTSTYIAGTVPLSLGNAAVTTFSDTQTGGGVGTLAAAGPSHYTFTVPLTTETVLQGTILGNPFGSTTGQTSAVVITGSVTINADGTATVNSTQDLTQTQTQTPNQTLPPTPYALPTILPPGSTANVILNLTLQTVTTSTTGTQSLVAAGAPHPCFADFNQDGGVDGADVAAFFGAWEAGSDTADVNQDGGVDGVDVGAFFIAWQSGGC